MVVVAVVIVVAAALRFRKSNAWFFF